MRQQRISDDLLKIIENDRQELVDLCLKLGNMASPHGKERKVGEAVLDWLKQSGIQGSLQFITEESVNAVATIPGSGNGTSLILNAHMDTGPELDPDATEAERKIETAWAEGELLFGKGVIRADGRKIHPMYLFQVKTPEESKDGWDVFKLLATIPGDEAFRPLAAGGCPLVQH